MRPSVLAAEKRLGAQIHTHENIHPPPTQIEYMHPGAHTQAQGESFGCVGELKAEDLKDKKAAVTYLQGKCSLVTWGSMKSSASAAHHIKRLPLFRHYMKTLSVSPLWK